VVGLAPPANTGVPTTALVPLTYVLELNRLLVLVQFVHLDAPVLR
jgi:hypothetical protein